MAIELICFRQLSGKFGRLRLPVLSFIRLAGGPIKLLLHCGHITLHKSDVIKTDMHVRGFELLRQRLAQNLLGLVKAIEAHETNREVCMRPRGLGVKADGFLTFLDGLLERSDHCVTVREQIGRFPVPGIGVLPDLQPFDLAGPFSGDATEITRRDV